MIEEIVLVDEAGQPIGVAEKFSSHHANTPLHLAFSCYVFNDLGEFLITQRALSKKVWPGVWTNSVCGHPRPLHHNKKLISEDAEMQESWEVEPMEEAIHRRLDYELGMTAKDIQVALPTYRYQTPPFNGIIENEFCPVFVARATSDPRPNPDEVENWKWVPWHEFVRAAKADSTDNYSWWCKDQLRQLASHPLILEFARPTS